MFLLFFFSLLGFLNLPNPEQSQAMGRSRSGDLVLMGVLGDSISAGTFSDIPLRPFARTLPEEDRPGIRLIRENKARLSWASGNSIDSHYRLLKQYLRQTGDPREVAVANVSNPGSKTEHLPMQAVALLQDHARLNHPAVIYITILIGSNDACSGRTGTPLANMHEDLMRTFAILSAIRQKEPLRILLVGIPRIPDLGAPAIRRLRTPLGPRCSTVRDKVFGYCPNLLRWKNEEEYHLAMDIVEDRNRLLRTIVIEAHARFPGLDVVYSNHLFNLEIPPAMLAIDCFHPSKRGQQAISREIWLDQPWFHLTENILFDGGTRE